MKSLIMEGLERSRVREIEIPAPDPGEVLIRMKYCGICSSELEPWKTAFPGQEALADMEQPYQHIALNLQSPENAMGQYNHIADAILKLDMLPDRFLYHGFRTRAC